MWRALKSGSALKNIALGTVFICFILYLMSKFEPVYSTGGAYPQTEHGNVDVNGNGVTGVSRPANTPGAGYTINTADFSKGACIHCHDQHSSYNGTTHTTVDMLLFDPGGANVNRYCYTCHTNSMTTGGSYLYPSWPGSATHDVSSHGTSASLIWPGANPAAKPAADVRKCTNCHDPHGSTFTVAAENTSGQRVYAGSNAMPGMLFRLEENLCNTCHDGSPASAGKNILAVFGRGANTGGTGVYYNHPTNRNAVANDRTPSVHSATETLALGGAGTARHAECADCHNPHYAKAGVHTPPTNLLSNVLLGTWGVSVAAWPSTQAKGNGTLQNAPAYGTTQLTNTATQYEWQLCMRCHSSYSTLPAFAAPNNVTDVSREFNPNNFAHHAVVAPGNNVSAVLEFRGNFRPPYAYNSVITCSDCHESSLDSANGMPGAVDPQGAHGSANKWILGNFCDSAAGAVCTTPEQTVICFKCHRFEVYFSGNYTVGVKGARFNHPFNGGHVNNTRNSFGIWCMTCHGGKVEGGIHGTNAAKGTSGTAAISEHFLNGSSILGFTPGQKAAPTTAGTCYMIAATNAYTNCNQHGSKTTGNPNYDYP